jgi:RNA polymerase sigma-70 factor (ECF subfamily)
VLYVDKAKTPIPEADWVGLVQSIAAGDQRALHALYERTHRIVFTLVVRITSNRETAEEVTLDVFHDVWRRASRYDPAGGSVVGWIMNQARSRAIDRLRFEQRKKRVRDQGAGPLPVAAASDPHDAFDLKEQGRLLRSALTVLTPEERQAIEAGLRKLRQALARSVKAP